MTAAINPTLHVIQQQTPNLPHSHGSLAIPHSQTSQNILLDSSIRDWVVLPLLIIMVFAGLIRHYLSLVLKSSKVKKIPKIEHRIKSTLVRSSRLRSGASGYIAKHKWQGRVRYFTEGEGSHGTATTAAADADASHGGYLREELQWMEEEQERKEARRSNHNSRMKKTSDSNSDDVDGGDKDTNGDAGEEEEDDMPDPMAMLGPMKGQFVFMAQNMILMQGIGYFFSGYILVKVPIPLTNGFKLMFQRGLDLSTLETSYVSSVSWYFLVMFGLRAFFKLVIDGDGTWQKEYMKAAMVQTELGNSLEGGSGGPSKKFDAEHFIKGEIENLELSKHKSILDDADRRLLGKKYTSGKRFVSDGSGRMNQSEPGFDIFGTAAATAAAATAAAAAAATTTTTRSKPSGGSKKMKKT